MSAAPEISPRTLIDDLLAEQRRLTPVERFARTHDQGSTPAQERYYRDLIPQTRPGAGEQYAFAVDLDACTGCKACVSACHSLNGLDEDEVWRNVGLLHGGTAEAPYQQTVTTACHHCVEPACLSGCPVMAYEKDSATGVVRHLDDQCIGCQYCILKCPYDVPKYSERLGIVRKCDMCIGRLSAGEAPACVQACPHEAITIKVVQRDAIVRESISGTKMLPGTFESSYTKPATQFTSRRELPSKARAADADDLRLEHPHWPLVWMLLLTQAAAGTLVVLAAAVFAGAALSVAQALVTAAWLMLHAGLAISILHLGRPLGAWRFFLGLRTSWMSREILAFGIFSVISTGTLAFAWLPPADGLIPRTVFVSAFAGMAAVFASAMIYVDTRREFWRASLTFHGFFGSALLLGAAISASLLAFINPSSSAAWWSAVASLVIRTLLFLWRSCLERRSAHDSKHPAHRSALIMQRHLLWIPSAQNYLYLLSMAAGLLTATLGNPAAALLAFVSTFLSQGIERYCFFATSPALRMPGGIPT
jgi:formate dehydrogenase iron-sulfur subunit